MKLVSSFPITLNIDAVTEQLDSCCSLFGLPMDSGVAAVREAAFARMANAERAMALTPEPGMDPLVRANRLEAEAARMHRLYQVRRQVMGFYAPAEAVQNKMLERLDDGITAGRAWGQFLALQGRLAEKLAAQREMVSGRIVAAMAVHADSDRVDSDLADLVSAPEAELVEA